ncbi:MAG: hypothetical protein Aurels2KO_18730 [Aureliella sp.]
MTIRTNPPGAMVYVDKQKIGQSPISTSFTYYGTREVEVVADGYRTERVLREIKPTWWQFPGLDFITETLWPFELRDERVIDIAMVPARQKTPEELLANGESMRVQASQASVVVPPTTAVVPSGPSNVTVPQFEPLPPAVVPQTNIPAPQPLSPPNRGAIGNFFNPNGNPPTRLPEVGILPGGGLRPPIESLESPDGSYPR